MYNRNLTALDYLANSGSDVFSQRENAYDNEQERLAEIERKSHDFGASAWNNLKAGTKGVASGLASILGADEWADSLDASAKADLAEVAPQMAPELSAKYLTSANGLWGDMWSLLGSQAPFILASMATGVVGGLALKGVQAAATGTKVASAINKARNAQRVMNAVAKGRKLGALSDVGAGTRLAAQMGQAAEFGLPMAVIEGATEAGNAISEARSEAAKRGEVLSDEERERIRDQVLRDNVAFLSLTNSVGALPLVNLLKGNKQSGSLLGRLGVNAAEGGASTLAEAYQEGGQKGIEQKAFNPNMTYEQVFDPRQWNKEQKSEFAHALAGMLPMAALGVGANTYRGRNAQAEDKAPANTSQEEDKPVETKTVEEARAEKETEIKQMLDAGVPFEKVYSELMGEPDESAVEAVSPDEQALRDEFIQAGYNRAMGGSNYSDAIPARRDSSDVSSQGRFPAFVDEANRARAIQSAEGVRNAQDVAAEAQLATAGLDRANAIRLSNSERARGIINRLRAGKLSESQDNINRAEQMARGLFGDFGNNPVQAPRYISMAKQQRETAPATAPTQATAPVQRVAPANNTAPQIATQQQNQAVAKPVEPIKAPEGTSIKQGKGGNYQVRITAVDGITNEELADRYKKAAKEFGAKNINSTKFGRMISAKDYDTAQKIATALMQPTEVVSTQAVEREVAPVKEEFDNVRISGLQTEKPVAESKPTSASDQAVSTGENTSTGQGEKPEAGEIKREDEEEVKPVEQEDKPVAEEPKQSDETNGETVGEGQWQKPVKEAAQQPKASPTVNDAKVEEKTATDKKNEVSDGVKDGADKSVTKAGKSLPVMPTKGKIADRIKAGESVSDDEVADAVEDRIAKTLLGDNNKRGRASDEIKNNPVEVYTDENGNEVEEVIGDETPAKSFAKLFCSVAKQFCKATKTNIIDFFKNVYINPDTIFENDKNALNQFAGIQAKVAMVDKLDMAIRGENAGLSAEKIFEKTGWFRGDDGMWRFYIPDNLDGINLNHKSLTSPRYRNVLGTKTAYGVKLSDLYKNDALFEAYPFLKSVKVRVTDNQSIYGQVIGKDTIELNLNMGDELENKKTLVHEIQHLIQKYEGFDFASYKEDVDEVWDSNSEVEARNTERLAGFERAKAHAKMTPMVEKAIRDGILDRSDSAVVMFGDGAVEITSPQVDATKAMIDSVARFNQIFGGVIKGQFSESKDKSGSIKRELRFSKTADTSTLIHELGHFILSQYRAFALADQNSKEADAYRTVMKWAKYDPRQLKEYEGTATYEQFKTLDEKIRNAKGAEREALMEQWADERFARGYEEWARITEGHDKNIIAPKSALGKAFSLIQEWLREIYDGVIGAKPSDKVQAIMARWSGFRDYSGEMLSSFSSGIEAARGNKSNEKVSETSDAKSESTILEFEHTKTADGKTRLYAEDIDLLNREVSKEDISKIVKDNNGEIKNIGGEDSYEFGSNEDADKFVEAINKSSASANAQKNSVESSELTDEAIDREWEKATKVDESQYTANEKLWQKLGKMFGLDVKIYTVGSSAINGRVHTGRNEMYLNRNSLADPKRTFWHEVFHILKANNNDLFMALKEALRVSDKTINKYRNSRADLKNEDNDFVLEEILADNMANSAERLNMFRKLAGLEDRSVIQKFMDYVKDMMDKFVELFHNPTGRLTTAQRNQMRAVLGKMAGSLVDANGNKIFKVSADGKRITAVDGEYNKQGRWVNSVARIDGHLYTRTNGNRPTSKGFRSKSDLKTAIAKWRISNAEPEGNVEDFLGQEVIDEINDAVAGFDTADEFEKYINRLKARINAIAYNFDGYGNFNIKEADIADYNKIEDISILKGMIEYVREMAPQHENGQGEGSNGKAGVRRNNPANEGRKSRNSVSAVEEQREGFLSSPINWLARKLNHGYDVDNPNASGIKKRELKPDRNHMGFIDRYLSSPSRIAEKYPRFAPLFKFADAAQHLITRKRTEYLDELDNAYAGLSEKESNILGNILTEGDKQHKEYSREELLESDGVNEKIADAYKSIRDILKKVRKEINEAMKLKLAGDVERAERKLASAIEDRDEYIATKRPAEDDKHLATLNKYVDVAQSELDEAKQSYDKADIADREGYIPHLYEQFLVYEHVLNKETQKYEDIIVDSAKSELEAYDKSLEYLKTHPDADLTIQSKAWNLYEKGIGDMQSAVTLGERDYINLMGKLDSMKKHLTRLEGESGNGKRTQKEIDAIRKNIEKQRDELRMHSKHRFLGALQQLQTRDNGDAFHTGYLKNEDIQTVLRHHLTTAARYIALEREFKPQAISHFEKVYGSFDKEHKGEALYAKEYINDVNGVPSAMDTAINTTLNKSEIWRKFVGVRFGDNAANVIVNNVAGVMAHLKLGLLNPSSALINLSQSMNAAAYLGGVKAYNRIAYWGTRKVDDLTDEMRHVLDECDVEYDIGLDATSGYDQNRSNGNKTADWLADKSMFLFKTSETALRKGVTLAAYEKAIKEGKSKEEAIAYARKINRKSNFDYSTADAPNMFRRSGMLGQILFQFKKYPIKEMEVVRDMLFNSSSAQARTFWGSYFLMAGLFQIPLFDWVDENIIETCFGKPLKPTAKKYMMEVAGNNPVMKKMAEVAMYGLFAGLPTGIDISARAGIGDAMPANVDDLLGVYIGTARNFIKEAKEHDSVGAIKAISPSLGNILTALVGESRTNRGRLSREYNSPTDRLKKMLGFRSTDEAIDSDVMDILYRERERIKLEKQELIDNFLDAESRHDHKEMARLYKEMKAMGIKKRTVDDERKRKKMTSRQRAENSMGKDINKIPKSLIAFGY